MLHVWWVEALSLLWIHHIFCVQYKAAPGTMYQGKHIPLLELMTACCNSTVHIQTAHQGGC